MRGLVWLLAAGLSATLASTTAASDAGYVAAEQVSQASYQNFMNAWLYTHTGDNRGFGPEHDLARDNIAFLFGSYGLTVTLEPFDWGGTYYNVVATQVGTLYPDQEYVLGAHYDSVDNPGADDDASGVALLLEVARIVSQYDSPYTIRYVAFDREEQGLIGSSAYVSDHFGDDILGMLQADMVAYDPDTDHALIYGHASASPLKNALGAAINEYSGGLTSTDAGWNGQSDHASFDAAGYMACLLIEGEVWNNPYYHTAQDSYENPDNLNFPYAVKMVRSVVGWLVDQAEVEVPVDAVGFAYPQGRPDFVAPAGGTRMPVETYGIGATVPQPGTGMLHYDIGSGWQSVPMDIVADNVYEAVFPAVTCLDEIAYYVSAEAVGGEVFTDPRNAPAASYSAVATYGETVLFADDFESNLGWSVSGDAATGQWQRGVPAGGGERGDPPTDFDGSGQCYLTGNAYGDSDVDGGYTYLTSPTIDLSGGDALIDFALWYTNNFGADPNNDLFKIYVSNNDGASWTLVETVGPETSSGWVVHAFWVGDHVAPTAQVRVQFEASDLNSGSVVEAGIDAFRVRTFDCEGVYFGDVNCDGEVNAYDIDAFICAISPVCGYEGEYPDCDRARADCNGDGDLNAYDIDPFIALVGGG